ncbi:MAG: MerR family transcriptional regulator [Ruminococcaceae bacterium]|nr:MerR family transcriptional regulator [Oscillospiraceae bacterium]
MSRVFTQKGEKFFNTIGQISEMFGLPISTLRYYDKEGLFPNIERQSFGEKEMEALNVIECLKKPGLEIKDIKKFMAWCVEGASTYKERKELFESRKKIVECEMIKLQKTLDMLNFKCWNYDVAIRDGNEVRLEALIPDSLPDDIRKLYDNAHS